jgi:tetratricopeptide (TPR) repeat protein
MTKISESVTSANEDSYENLISLIENNQNQLSLIIASCDDLILRQQIIDRYEQEAKLDNIQAKRIVLGTEPSLRAGLAKLELPIEARVVVTVTGSEWLLRVKTRASDAQSDLQKFFGYLQWTREGLREFQYPVVLWITSTILLEMSRKAPDFWSWRKAVLRFASESNNPVLPVEREYSSTPTPEAFTSSRFDRDDDDDFIPPPAEILLEISKLAERDPKSPNLATLYAKLAEIYTKRIASGEATDLEQEQQQAIDAYHQTIDRYRIFNKKSTLASTINQFATFLFYRSQYSNAINFYKQSLEIWREVGDKNGEANALSNLGNAYRSIGEHQLAIDFNQQALEIKHEIGDLRGEANSLNGLGNIYQVLGQYRKAIEIHQQSLEIQRRIGEKKDVAVSFNGLGVAYQSLEQYQRAIEFYQQSLEIQHTTGDLRGEAASLCNLGVIHRSLKQYQQAINFYQQSLEIQRTIGDRHGEASSLGNIGVIYGLLGDYQRAIDFYQQSLEIQRTIGDRSGEAAVLFNHAQILKIYQQQSIESLNKFTQARAIYIELKLDEKVEECDEEIRMFDRTISTEQHETTPLT